jgi:hypothetical protein
MLQQVIYAGKIESSLHQCSSAYIPLTKTWELCDVYYPPVIMIFITVLSLLSLVPPIA